MSDFRIKVNVELDTSNIESKLNALGKDLDLEVKLDMSKITSQIKEIKSAFKDAFKVDSKFANDLKNIANLLKKFNNNNPLGDPVGGGGGGKPLNSLMQQYKELYRLREKLQKQMASGKLGDDSIERTSEQIARLTKQMNALKNSMSDSQKSGIELFDAKQSTKSLVDMNNYLNKIETQASSLGTKLNSISFEHIDSSKIEKIQSELKEIQNIAGRDIDLDLNVGDILSNLQRIQSEIKNLEKVENLASSFDRVKASISSMDGGLDGFKNDIKSVESALENLESSAMNLDGSFERAFASAKSGVKGLESSMKSMNSSMRRGSGGIFGTMDDFKSNFAQFTLAEVAGDLIADGIRTMARGFRDTVVETDSAITDLNKVYEKGLSGDNLKSYLNTFTEVAKGTGKTSVDVIQGTTKAVQSGISDLDQAIKYATKASMLSNVGDIEQGQADTMLASVMSAYGGVENSIKPVREQITGMGKDYDTLTKFIDLANYAGELSPSI